MKNSSSRIFLAALATVVFALTLNASAAETETVLYAFHGLEGASPVAVFLDSTGTIYGVTEGGGNTGSCIGCGTVFRLAPASGGGWTQTTLHEFSSAPDGRTPLWGLVEDGGGNLFGAALAGGGNACDCGAVYELSPDGSGGFTYQVIYTFTGTRDGGGPVGVVIGPDGNLYGNAQIGGMPTCAAFSQGCGVVFQLSPPAVSGDPWVETTIYHFTGAGDGFTPQPLTFDAAGNLYGFAQSGGNTTSPFCASIAGCGTAFRLSPSAGAWTFSTLFRFQQNTGASPTLTAPAFDAAGNLYGVTFDGGRTCTQSSIGCGTLFKLTPTSSGPWSFALLHTFTGAFDGAAPEGALALDAAGNVYGITDEGGGTSCGQSIGCGTVYKVSPSAGGGWQFSRLWAFPGMAGGGFFPAGGPILDPSGNLIGTTQAGGNHSNVNCNQTGCGLVYELSSTPNAAR